MTYGKIIKKHRKKMKMPQQYLAKQAQISQGNISKIENDRLSVTAWDLFSIARVLKIKCKELQKVGANDI